ncbi:phosphatidate cytidylyltransferase [Lachnospiraceae bacterium OttesenSCG-928-J05]|nr:phosphatidate cytidylyltransferase [Lachnospiraceae bacterium OttesenSCG-928-J05]
MFKTRLLSGIVLVAILALVIGLGGNVLFGFCLLISLIGMNELFKIAKTDRKAPGIMAYGGIILYYFVLLLGAKEYVMATIIITLVAILATYVFTFPTYDATQIVLTFFGVIYVGVMLSYIYQSRMSGDGVIGVAIVVLIFLASWGSDTCAYCVGMLFGKHKMAPILSPKKSIEGAVGGVVGAALLGCLFAFVLNQANFGSHSVVRYGIICGVGALISMVGDLAASGIKRNHQVKDYGHLIPGHGGILDRFDSVIFTAPIIYYLSQLLSNI